MFSGVLVLVLLKLVGLSYPRTPETATSLSKTKDALILPEHAESIGHFATKNKLTNTRSVPILIRLEEPLKIAEHIKDAGDAFIIEPNQIHSIEDLSTIKSLLDNKAVLISISHSMVVDNFSSLHRDKPACRWLHD